MIRLGEPNATRTGDDPGTSPVFDPVWGTLGAATGLNGDGWPAEDDADLQGPAVDVEILGADFQISGQIHTGNFDRLSDWINMQTGFIRVANALHLHPGSAVELDADERRATLWVRLSQIVLMAERAPVAPVRSGAPEVPKERQDVSIVTPGYDLRGDLHIHAHGSMTQFLETPEPHFLPMTDLVVRWLDDPTMIASFPFAMVNRAQLVTVHDWSRSGELPVPALA
jgi:hypothetical protein